MDSNICVATITGRAYLRQVLTISFCKTGTVAIGHSTPKSPRATIIPSDSLTMASSSLMALGFSSLEIIHALSPMSFRASLTSFTLCTKERQTQSTPSSSANFKSSLSFCVMAEIGNLTFGKLTPLCAESSPPTTTLVSAQSLPQFLISSSILPSLSNNLSPFFITAKISLCGRHTLVSSPALVSISRRKVCPFLMIILLFLNVPILSLGPCKSAIIVRLR